MTEKQKKAFLKAEGWRPYKVSDGTYGIDGWRDTKEKHVLESLAPIEFAYRTASRRKRQREARALRKAGYRWSAGAPGIEAAGWSLHRSEEEQLKHALDFWTGKVPLDQIMTRQEALQTLESQP